MAKVYTRNSKLKAARTGLTHALLDRPVVLSNSYGKWNDAVKLSGDRSVKEGYRVGNLPTGRVFPGVVDVDTNLVLTEISPRVLTSIKRLMEFRGRSKGALTFKAAHQIKVVPIDDIPISVKKRIVSKNQENTAKPSLLYGKAARAIADPNLGLAVRALHAGAVPGQQLDDGSVALVLCRIAASAKDMFGTAEAAMDYLDRDTFGGTGQSARELLASGRGTTVIARLDSMRFGTQG